MAQISNINPERIQWCCRMISVDLRHLADATKIKIDNLRQGRLTYNQLDKVAKFFGHTPIFFLGDKPLTAEEIYSPEFRALAGQKVPLDRHTYRIIQQVEWCRELYLCLIEDMKMEEDIPEFDPPALTGAIEEKAAAVRKWLGLDDSIARDYHQYRKLIEAKGILIFQSIDTGGDWDMRDSKAAGFSISYPRTPVIFIKKTTEPMQTLTLFVELGNILLHNASFLDSQEQLAVGHIADSAAIEQRPDQFADKRSTLDRMPSTATSEGKENYNEIHERIRRQEAHQFALECLAPSRLLPTEIPDRAENYDQAFGEIARNRGISVEMVAAALAKQKRITPDKYKDYREIRIKTKRQREPEQSRRIKHKEPLQIFGRTYVGVILNALGAREITLNKTCGYLNNISVDDIRKIPRAWI